MAINWFEGGRRITQLFQGIVYLGGAAYVLFGGSTDYVTFESSNPDRDWTYTQKPCSYPDHSEYIYDGINIGKVKDVELCFREVKGSLLYEFAGYQEDGDKPIPASAMLPGARRDPNKTPTYHMTNGYSQEGIAYMNARKEAFRVSDAAYADARSNQWKKPWIAGWNRFVEAIPWVLGIVFGFWVFSVIVGWIARGFAGIPSGQDHRPKTDRAN